MTTDAPETGRNLPARAGSNALERQIAGRLAALQRELGPEVPTDIVAALGRYHVDRLLAEATITDFTRNSSTAPARTTSSAATRSNRRRRRRHGLQWQDKRRAARAFSCAPLVSTDQRRELKAARSSEENSSGSSQAAKWPPLSTSWK
jgi:hypothetical protein